MDLMDGISRIESTLSLFMSSVAKQFEQQGKRVTKMEKVLLEVYPTAAMKLALPPDEAVKLPEVPQIPHPHDSDHGYDEVESAQDEEDNDQEDEDMEGDHARDSRTDKEAGSMQPD